MPFVATTMLALAQIGLGPEIRQFEELITAGQYAKAEPMLERYTAAHPKIAESWYQLGYVYFQAHKTWPSVKALSKSLSINPGQADAHRILGLNFTILGRLDLAKTELERAVALDSTSADAHYSLGRVLYEQGDYSGSVKHLERSLSLKPESVKTLHNLALTYEALNQYDRARELFKQAVILEKQSSQRSEWPYINFGSFLNRRAEFSQAITVLLQGQIVNGQSDALEFELAKAHRGMQNWKAALEALQKAIGLSPDNAEYRYVLANLYRAQGKMEEAKAALAEFARLKKASPSGPAVAMEP